MTSSGKDPGARLPQPPQDNCWTWPLNFHLSGRQLEIRRDAGTGLRGQWELRFPGFGTHSLEQTREGGWVAGWGHSATRMLIDTLNLRESSL